MNSLWRLDTNALAEGRVVVITTLKKKRKIRWDRVLLLISPIIVGIIISIILVTRKENIQPVKPPFGIVNFYYGKRITSDSNPLPDITNKNKLEYIGEFLLTGYCDCEECQEEWVGTTATGVKPTEGNTIAVDPKVIPLGSYVWIDGVRYHAEDVGGMINDEHIDVFVGSHDECYSNFCNGYHDVYLEVSES